MTIAAARAFPNIALVKYWGKRDEELILPAAGSLSLTLDAFATTTTVEVTPSAEADAFDLNGSIAIGEAAQRVSTFLDHVRALAAPQRAHGSPPPTRHPLAPASRPPRPGSQHWRQRPRPPTASTSTDGS